MVTRRQFLKTGLIGAAALAAVGSWYGYRHHGAGRIDAGAALDAEGHAIVSALAPVLLQGALPDDNERGRLIAQVASGVERAISGLSAAAQKEVRNLFALLAFAPTRILVVRLRHPWAQASHEEIAAFLEGWRYSRFPLLQSGYAALHDLVIGAWYADPASWAAIDYPGPPEVF
jgi:hypothetical protein